MTAERRRFPPGMLTAGRVIQWALARGMPMGPLGLLHTRGRSTGQDRAIPVAVLRTSGHEWLVSPFGATAWVLNVRANGEAALGRGDRREPIALAEVHDDRVPAVLRSYRRRFAAVPFVRAAFDATGRDDLDAFAREAARHPVFHLARATTAKGLPRPEDGPSAWAPTANRP